MFRWSIYVLLLVITIKWVASVIATSVLVGLFDLNLKGDFHEQQLLAQSFRFHL